ncbi:MAG: threonine synthase [Clostridiales bacterium]|nr:threonine synthase [Clostridiales bacterium]
MNYTSTRDKALKVSSCEAITKGISSDGGLFLPTEIPSLTADDISRLVPLGYKQRAKDILARFLTDYTPQELSACVEGAYADGKFSSEAVAPVVNIHDGVNVLELWKGPTCAFKDMALQLLPHLLTTASGKLMSDTQTVILVATSGDTGKAALEGFSDVAGTKILVFYPNDGVSPMQKLQMTTQEGSNVGVCAVQGNFDDAQNGVKAIFTDEAIVKKLRENGCAFSSANSMNWGRLVPQIVYYISAYCDLVASGAIANGEKINVTVPTGNFGNILAAYYAKRMGLPIKKLICASNANNVLTDFINTGIYDRNRHFYLTSSPSMDILISSNLERLLFELCGRDDACIREWFGKLKAEGRYEVSDSVKSQISDLFAAGFCDDAATKAAIKDTFEKYGYLCDTHTAVAVSVYNDYLAKTGDDTPVVIASTASPFKFCSSVLDALKPGKKESSDEFGMIEELEAVSGCLAPAQLKALKGKKVRFTDVSEKENMDRAVFSMLGITE